MTNPSDDPRVVALARARRELTTQEWPATPAWDELTTAEQAELLPAAGLWLTAAIRAGLTAGVPLRLREAVDRALTVLDDLSADSGDRAPEALAARRELARALMCQPLPPQDREVRASVFREAEWIATWIAEGELLAEDTSGRASAAARLVASRLRARADELHPAGGAGDGVSA